MADDPELVDVVFVSEALELVAEEALVEEVEEESPVVAAWLRPLVRLSVA